MAAVACSMPNNLTGQLALSFSQPALKSTFYPEQMFTVQEEVDTNANHVPKFDIGNDDVVRQKTASLHRGMVRFAHQLETTSDLSTASDLSNSKDSGIGSTDDSVCQSDDVLVERGDDQADDEEEEESVVEEDGEHVRFKETAKKFTEVGDVEKMPWEKRKERMDNCLGWLREEIFLMKKQDQSLMRQFMELRSTIHQLKRAGTQESLRSAYLRNRSSCANLRGANSQSAQSAEPMAKSHLHSSLRPFPGPDQSLHSNLSAFKPECVEEEEQLHNQELEEQKEHEEHEEQEVEEEECIAVGGNLSQMQSVSRMNLGSLKPNNSLLHLEYSNFDMDTYFADFDGDQDSFVEEDDSDTFVDHPGPLGGAKASALSEDEYMPQYRTRTVSLVTHQYIGRPILPAYLARSRYMSFSTAKGRVESERAILE